MKNAAAFKVVNAETGEVLGQGSTARQALVNQSGILRTKTYRHAVRMASNFTLDAVNTVLAGCGKFKLVRA